MITNMFFFCVDINQCVEYENILNYKLNYLNFSGFIHISPKNLLRRGFVMKIDTITSGRIRKTFKKKIPIFHNWGVGVSSMSLKNLYLIRIS